MTKKERYARVVTSPESVIRDYNSDYICNNNPVMSAIASQNDVPGNKSFVITLDNNTLIYNYVPVNRIYLAGNNKFPSTTWRPGLSGFPIGNSGSSPEMRKFARNNYINNIEFYSIRNNNPCK